MSETIQPGVVIDGQTIYPPGWAWIFAFALRGVPWAIAELEKPEVAEQVEAWRNRQLDPIETMWGEL